MECSIGIVSSGLLRRKDCAAARSRWNMIVCCSGPNPLLAVSKACFLPLIPLIFLPGRHSDGLFAHRRGAMGASTIVVAREDLSIPGAADAAGNGAARSAADIEARFFDVVRQFNPDVVVLDLTGSPSNGTAAILKIRRRTGVPILVVCDPSDPLMREYCLAGAAEANAGTRRYYAAESNRSADNSVIQKLPRFSGVRAESDATGAVFR